MFFEYFLLSNHRGRVFEAWTEGYVWICFDWHFVTSVDVTNYESRTTVTHVRGLRFSDHRHGTDSGLQTHKRAFANFFCGCVDLPFHPNPMEQSSGATSSQGPPV